MKKNSTNLIFLVICVLIVVIVLALCIRPWVWLRSEPDRERQGSVSTGGIRRAKRRAYLQHMKSPTLTGKEVAEMLRKEKTIKDRQLYDLADWYAYHGDREVIRQVLINRQFEMEITLPEEHRGTSVKTDYTVSSGYKGPWWGTDREILVQQEVLQEYADRENVDPHFMFYLLDGNLRFHSEPYKIYYNQLLFRDQILAYLRIYVTFKKWPTIRALCERKIEEYPCVWRDWATIEKILAIADDKGPEQAFRLYMDRYRSNYQEFLSVVYDFEDPKKAYDCDGVSKGWSSDKVFVKMNVHDVDSEDVFACIRYVRKVSLVLRNGKNITNLCEVRPGNYLRIPLRAGKLIEIEFKVYVTPEWWDQYMQKRLIIDIPGV